MIRKLSLTRPVSKLCNRFSRCRSDRITCYFPLARIKSVCANVLSVFQSSVFVILVIVAYSMTTAESTYVDRRIQLLATDCDRMQLVKVRELLSRVALKGVVTDDRFEMLPSSCQSRLLSLLPAVDHLYTDDYGMPINRLSDSALSNKFMESACSKWEKHFQEATNPTRKTVPDIHPLHWRRDDQESLAYPLAPSNCSQWDAVSISTSAPTGHHGITSGVSHQQQSIEYSSPLEYSNPLEYLVKACAEVDKAPCATTDGASATLPVSTSVFTPSVVNVGSLVSAAALPTPASVPNVDVLSAAAAATAAGGADYPGSSAHDYVEDVPVRRKRGGAGRRTSRTEAQAASGTSARTGGLRKDEASGIPVRKTGATQLMKAAPNAKIPLRNNNRFPTCMTAVQFFDSNFPDVAEGNSYTVVLNSFDHAYLPASSNVSLVHVHSRGFSDEHCYAQPASQQSSNSSHPRPRRSLADLTALPSLSLSSSAPQLRDPMSFSLQSLPLQPVAIEDANIVSQCSSHSAPDLSLQPRTYPDMSSYSSTLSLNLLAATANPNPITPVATAASVSDYDEA
eukprot:scpid71339/ scgid20782/ 